MIYKCNIEEPCLCCPNPEFEIRFNLKFLIPIENTAVHSIQISKCKFSLMQLLFNYKNRFFCFQNLDFACTIFLFLFPNIYHINKFQGTQDYYSFLFFKI